jgi:hypothetical protein
MLIDVGFVIVFDSQRCLLLTKGSSPNIVVRGARNQISGLYKLTTHVSNVELNLVENLEEVFLWHKRLGHLNFQILFHLRIRNVTIGLPKLPFVSSTCECCQLGKQHKE